MINSIFSKKENDLDGRDFKRKFEATENAVLIDVRTPAEFTASTIEGARNIDLMASDFQSRIQELDRNKTYFLFCRTGNRSGSAASLFEKLGFKSYNLVGGVGAWPQ